MTLTGELRQHAVDCGIDLLGITSTSPFSVARPRGLRHARSSGISRAAAAHMWRFASVQRPDGRFPDGEYDPSQVHMLQVFSGYDHPASRVAILRSIPWIIDNQNPDGSWGEGDGKDVSTLAVVQALLLVRELLPAALDPCRPKE